jgi:CheY-like chemotaxis protein
MLTQPQSILVVEDSSGVALVLQALLEGEGYRVLSATSIKEAIELLRTTPVDLILTDAFSSTPQAALDSVAPLLEAAGRIPVALLSGHQISLEDAQARGFCAVIPKPFAVDTLLDEIRHCLSGEEVVT